MLYAYGHGCSLECVLTEDDACHYCLVGFWRLLVEDEVPQTVKDRNAVEPTLRLHHMRMVSYDGVCACCTEYLCLSYLLRRGVGLELNAPVEYTDDVVRRMPGTIGAYDPSQTRYISLAWYGVAVFWHPVFYGNEHGTE